LGNLLNRMASLAHAHAAFELPVTVIWADAALTLRDECLTAVEEMGTYMEGYQYHMAIARLWKCINQVNGYFHSQEPWKVVKKDRELFIQILSATAHSLRAIALLLWPVMPKTAEQILESLGTPFDRSARNLEQLKLGMWHHSFMIKKIAPLFTKPEEKKVEPLLAAEASKMNDTAYISIDDLLKVQLVIGTIESCEDVAGSDKLLSMKVNLGDFGMRSILAGIRQSYAAQDLVGKQALFVANLPPRKMMGLESQGMMLVSEGADKKVRITMPATPVPNGTRLR
jgi:methionyl-tRNA synthetase